MPENIEDYENNISNKNNINILRQFILLYKQTKYDLKKNLTKKEKIENFYRLRQLSNIIKIISNYKSEIKSGEQLKDIKGIGKGSINRINEILEKGKLEELQNTKFINKKNKIMDELEKVFGIGEKTASELVNKYKVKSIEDLKNKYKKGKIELNEQIIVGLKYYDVYKQNIPYNEVKKIENYLIKKAKSIDNNNKVKVCGSYRRKKKFSNDIDVLLTNKKIKDKLDMKNSENILLNLVNSLKKNNFLLDDLTFEDYKTKYMGFCRLNENYPIRRIDIRYVPHDSYYTALLYFTGSGNFNSKMRNVAKSLGYKLNEYGLYNLTENKKKMVIKSEKDIFDILGMEYIEPKLR